MEQNKYSKIYKIGHFNFRYNYANAELECIWKDEETGQYDVIDSQGLSAEHWKASPTDYLRIFAAELEEETAILLDDYAKYG